MYTLQHKNISLIVCTSILHKKEQHENVKSNVNAYDVDAFVNN